MLMVEYIEVRPVGIDQNAEAGMAIYPNPAQNNLTIQMDNSSNYSIQLLRMDGQMVIEQHASDKISQLDVSKLSSGIYIIQVKSLSTAEIFTKKILIQ
jgi:hypothetical protein